MVSRYDMEEIADNLEKHGLVCDVIYQTGHGIFDVTCHSEGKDIHLNVRRRKIFVDYKFRAFISGTVPEEYFKDIAAEKCLSSEMNTWECLVALADCKKYGEEYSCEVEVPENIPEDAVKGFVEEIESLGGTVKREDNRIRFNVRYYGVLMRNLFDEVMKFDWGRDSVMKFYEKYKDVFVADIVAGVSNCFAKDVSVDAFIDHTSYNHFTVRTDLKFSGDVGTLGCVIDFLDKKYYQEI